MSSEKETLEVEMTSWQKAKRTVCVSPLSVKKLKTENSRRNRREARQVLRDGNEPNPPMRLNDRDIW